MKWDETTGVFFACHFVPFPIMIVPGTTSRYNSHTFYKHSPQFALRAHAVNG